MCSPSYTAGRPGFPASDVFGVGIRPVLAPVALGRVQNPANVTSAAATSPRSSTADTKTSDESRQTKHRGSLRGRRDEPPLNLDTKPKNFVTKLGEAGEKISLTANYFTVNRPAGWTLEQYRIDFKPDVVSIGMRRALLRNVMPAQSGYLFDGTVLFTVQKIFDGESEFEKAARSRENDEYLVVFKHVKTVSTMESTSLQVFNLVFRQAMSKLNLQLVGRNHFDADASVSHLFF